MIKAIYFDCFEVLIPGLLKDGIMGQLVEQKLGMTREQYAQKDTGSLWAIFLELNRGHLTEKEYWSIVIKSTGWKCNPEQIIALSDEVSRGCMPGMLEIVQQLHASNYELYMISDVWAEQKQRLLLAHPWISKLFKECFFSYEHERIKSDPNFFEQITEKWHNKPDECLFIDDYHVNTENASKAGYKTIIFQNASQLKSELRAMQLL